MYVRRWVKCARVWNVQVRVCACACVCVCGGTQSILGVFTIYHCIMASAHVIAVGATCHSLLL